MSRSRATALFAGGGTGGHLYPGIAIARTLVRLDPRVRAVLHRRPARNRARGAADDRFPHLLLDLHPLYRRGRGELAHARGAVGAWRAVGALIAGSVRARRRHRRVRGGRRARLRAWCTASRSSSRPVTATPVSPRAPSAAGRGTYLAFPEAARVLGGDPAQLIDTGAPIEPPPSHVRTASRRARIGAFPDGRRVLLIYGGSQGSRAMNLRCRGLGQAPASPTTSTSSG